MSLPLAASIGKAKDRALGFHADLFGMHKIPGGLDCKCLRARLKEPAKSTGFNINPCILISYAARSHLRL